MDVIMFGPWMLSSQNGIDHGCHHGRDRHTMVKKRVIRPRAEQKRMQAKGALVSHTTKECSSAENPTITSAGFGCL